MERPPALRRSVCLAWPPWPWHLLCSDCHCQTSCLIASGPWSDPSFPKGVSPEPQPSIPHFPWAPVRGAPTPEPHPSACDVCPAPASLDVVSQPCPPDSPIPPPVFLQRVFPGESEIPTLDPTCLLQSRNLLRRPESGPVPFWNPAGHTGSEDKPESCQAQEG